MPAPTKGRRLGGGSAHQRRMLANLAVSLFEHGSIKTTQTKAKRLQPLAERLISKAKVGDLAARRQVAAVLPHNRATQSIIHELFTEIAPAMAERPGGYTRIIKLGNRPGDNAPIALIELVREPYSPKVATVKEAEAATARAAKDAEEAVAEDATDEEATEDAVEDVAEEAVEADAAEGEEDSEEK